MTGDGLKRCVVNGRDVEAQRFDWGQIAWLDNAELTGAETLTLGMVEILAGMKNPRHYHPNCDEALTLLEGELRHWIGEDVYPLHAGDTIHIPQGAWHQAENVGQATARMLVCYNSGRRETVFEP